MHSLSVVKLEPGEIVKLFAEAAITGVWVAQFGSFGNVERLLMLIRELLHERAPEYVPSGFHCNEVCHDNVENCDGTYSKKDSCEIFVKGDWLVDCFYLHL